MQDIAASLSTIIARMLPATPPFLGISAGTGHACGLSDTSRAFWMSWVAAVPEASEQLIDFDGQLTCWLFSERGIEPGPRMRRDRTRKLSSSGRRTCAWDHG